VTTAAESAASIDDVERAAWVAFNRAPGVGVVRFRRLLDRFGTLSDAWRASSVALAEAGLDRRSVEGVVQLQGTLDPERELARVRAAGLAVVTWRDEAYPELLGAIPDPPPVLYVRGSLAPHDGGAVAMVGTRRATVYGRDVAERLARDLAQHGITIVSGLAKGIDTHAHRGALAGGGRTIAVLAHGLDTLYPPENRRLAAEMVERGALVSDYPLGTGPLAENFPPRNRIISGLAAGVIVVEADHRSGALITSKFALEQGRDVFAVPGPINAPSSRGCNRLIQDGARLIASAEDVLLELNPHLVAPRAAPAPTQLTLEDGHPLVAALRELGQAAHVDELARSLGLPIAEVTGGLALLELTGQVRHAGVMRYQLTS
jgi:DNA processing protein